MAKRVNSKFLGFLVGATAAVAVLGSTAVVTWRFRSHGGDPKRLTAAGDEAMKKGDWEAAKDDYQKARAVDPDNTDILVKFGDAMERLTPKEPLNLEQGVARSGVRPCPSTPTACRPWRSCSRATRTRWSSTRGPDLFAGQGLVRQAAGRPPRRPQGAGAKQLAVISQWLDANQTATPEEVRNAVADNDPRDPHPVPSPP